MKIIEYNKKCLNNEEIVVVYSVNNGMKQNTSVKGFKFKESLLARAFC